MKINCRGKGGLNVSGVLVGMLSIPFLGLMMLKKSENGILPTIFFLFIIYGIIIRNILRNNLKSLFIFIALKVVFSIIVLYIGWVPNLEYGSNAWGYDPQRYYLYATDLANSNFDQSVLPGLNYKGIVYYYAIFFKIFGCNPIVPILINTLTTYIAMVYVIKIIRCILPKFHHTKYMGFFLLLPEIFWYDIISSRETICMTLVLISSYYLLSQTYKNKKMEHNSLLILFISLILLGAIRTSLLFIPMCLIIYILIKKKSLKLLLVSGVLMVAIIGTSLIGNKMGSATTLSDGFKRIFDTNQLKNIGEVKWNTNSIGLRLIGNSIWQKIILLPIRMFVYIIAPLPNIGVSFSAMKSGDWGEWQHLLTVVSSCGYIAAFPYFIASLLDSVMHKKIGNIRYCWVPFLISASVVAGGNAIIHERYRIVFIPYYVLIVVTGIYSKQRYKLIGILITLLIFIVGMILYVIAKF